MSEHKVAMVGTPCEIMAASKIQHYTDSVIDFKIGLFCMENFSYSYFSQLLDEYDLTMDKIEKFRIEKGNASLYLKNGELIKIPLSIAKSVVRKNCHICVELSSETSDISVGSIGSKNGWSTLIVRTQKGLDAVEDAVKLGYIEIKDLTESQFNLLNKIASNKINNNIKTIEKRESNARPVLYQRSITDKSIDFEVGESNFDDLRANVINVGSCVLCGACEYACPENLITINDSKPRKSKKCPPDCHLCFEVCPRTYVPNKLRNDNSKPLGEYKKILTVKSLKQYNSQDGGVVTAMLDYLISNDIVTEALVVDKKDNLAWKPYPLLTSNIDDIVKSAGTKYSVCPIFKPLNDLSGDVI